MVTPSAVVRVKRWVALPTLTLLRAVVSVTPEIIGHAKAPDDDAIDPAAPPAEGEIPSDVVEVDAGDVHADMSCAVRRRGVRRGEPHVPAGGTGGHRHSGNHDAKAHTATSGPVQSTCHFRPAVVRLLVIGCDCRSRRPPAFVR